VKAAVLTVSDRSSRGEREDAGGPAVEAALRDLGFDVATRAVVADDRGEIARRLRALAATHDLVVTTGGTGLGPRDVTPEATRDVLDREAPGFGEEMRRRSAAAMPRAILSRATAGSVGRCLVVNLPGSPRGAVECLGHVADPLRHAVALLRGGVADCAAPGKSPGA
jgi:molybdenum cofactor synthesis domain-containing protein